MPICGSSGILQPASTTSISTVMDNSSSPGTIPANEFSVSFPPLNELGQVNGELTFGGIDPRKYTGLITYQYVPTCF
jgi:cathepsin E